MTAIERFGSRYIDPMVDWSFKRLFGTEVNKDILIGFLNVVFPEYGIKDITYIPTEQLGMMSSDRKAVFDVLCRTEDGKDFLVEMQRCFQEHFYERALFYTSFPIMKQGRRRLESEAGDGSGVWDFALDGVFFLGVLNFSSSDDGRVVHRFRLIDTESRNLMTDRLEYVFVDVSKFHKTEPELETDMDRWVYLLKNLSRLLERPAALRDRIFGRIFEVSEIAAMDDVEQKEYVNSMNTERDLILQMRYMKKQGHEEGLAEGMKEGIEKGSAEAKREDAGRMLALGLPVDVIMKVTGLPEDVIASLKTV